MDAVKLAAEICDHYCKFPVDVDEPEALEMNCRGCPMARLLALAEEGERADVGIGPYDKEGT